jgi:hypothetical protein
MARISVSLEVPTLYGTSHCFAISITSCIFMHLCDSYSPRHDNLFDGIEIIACIQMDSVRINGADDSVPLVVIEMVLLAEPSAQI